MGYSIQHLLISMGSYLMLTWQSSSSFGNIYFTEVRKSLNEGDIAMLEAYLCIRGLELSDLHFMFEERDKIFMH